MAFFEFPHTRTYDSDLGWLIKSFSDFKETYGTLEAWAKIHEQEYKDLKTEVNALIQNMTQPVEPWDGTKSYLRYTLVEYSGDTYIALQDVPAGVLITNTTYWGQAQTIQAELNAIKADIIALEKYTCKHYETVEDMIDDFEADDYICAVYTSGAIISNDWDIRRDILNYYIYDENGALFEYALDNGGYAMLVPHEFTDYHNDPEILPAIMKTMYSYCDNNVPYVHNSGPYKDVGYLSGMQCSQFVETLIHGLPYERSRLVSSAYANLPSAGAFTDFVDNDGTEIYLGANEIAHYAALLGYYKNTDLIKDVEVGDILFWGDDTYLPYDWKGISHCAMCVGRGLNSVQVVQCGYFTAPDAGALTPRFYPGPNTDGVNMVTICLDENTPYVNSDTYSLRGFARLPLHFAAEPATSHVSANKVAATSYSAGDANHAETIIGGSSTNFAFAIATIKGYSALINNKAAMFIASRSYGSLFGDSPVTIWSTNPNVSTGGLVVIPARKDSSYLNITLTYRLTGSDDASSYALDLCELDLYDL